MSNLQASLWNKKARRTGSVIASDSLDIEVVVSAQDRMSIFNGALDRRTWCGLRRSSNPTDH